MASNHADYPRLIEKGPDGWPIGRHPKEIGREALIDCGFSKRPILRVVREKCIDCCSGVESEVRKCTAVSCALWPYRMAWNPFSDRKGTFGRANDDE